MKKNEINKKKLSEIRGGIISEANSISEEISNFNLDTGNVDYNDALLCSCNGPGVNSNYAFLCGCKDKSCNPTK